MYVRQSVKEDEGISQQLELTKARVIGEGWQLVGEYNDNAVSATKDRGTGTDWARLLDDIDKGRIDVVVATTAARLLRRVEDVTELTKRKVRIVSVRDGIDTSNSFGQSILTIIVSLAEAEIQEKEDRARPYRAARRAAGHPSPGLVPYGYAWVPKVHRDEKGTRYAIVPKEAEVLRRASAAFLAGDSLRGICASLNAEGITTRKGKPWIQSTLRRLLLSPFAAAMLPPKMPEGQRYDALAFAWSECSPGAWEPILDANEVIAARAKLANPERRTQQVKSRVVVSLPVVSLWWVVVRR